MVFLLVTVIFLAFPAIRLMFKKSKKGGMV
jgi:hypothetical protein